MASSSLTVSKYVAHSRLVILRPRMSRLSETTQTARGEIRKWFVLTSVALTLIVFGAVSLAIAVIWHPPGAGIAHAAHELFVALWPFFLTVAAGLIVYERWLRDTFVAELKRVSGPQLIQLLQPRTTLHSLLDLVYGTKRPNRDVVVGVLGGFGEATDRRDLSISDETAIKLTLADADDREHYDFTITAEYIFGERQADADSFILFVTSSPRIRDSLVTACDRPLFDYWYFPGRDDIPDLLPLMNSMRVDLRYEDKDDNVRWTGFFTPELKPVKPEHWGRYLRVFREDVGALRRLRPGEYESKFAILTFDFSDALEKDYLLKRFLGLRVTSTTQQLRSDGYCYWTATYPCFVTEIEFDTSDFSDPGTARALEFRKAPFLLHADSERDTWARRPQPVRPDTWLLPGHGVVLMWRPGETQPVQ